KESISFFSDEELLEEGINHFLLNQKNYIKARGVLGDHEYFDAQFFGYSPREAEILDPQHRVFLECCWEALEDAGYDSEKTSYRIGVYGGTGSPWQWIEIYKNPSSSLYSNGVSILTGNDK